MRKAHLFGKAVENEFGVTSARRLEIALQIAPLEALSMASGRREMTLCKLNMVNWR